MVFFDAYLVLFCALVTANLCLQLLNLSQRKWTVKVRVRVCALEQCELHVFDSLSLSLTRSLSLFLGVYSEIIEEGAIEI